MIAILNERQITEQQEELIELSRSTPEKFDHEFEFQLNNATKTKYRTYTQEEVQRLIEASKAPCEVPKTPIKKTRYQAPPRELVEKLVREFFEYKEEQEKKKQQETMWDSLKMTESETRTSIITRHSSSTKVSSRSATRTKKS